MLQLPTISVRGIKKPILFIQGGMGAGISLAHLAGAVAKLGGMGTVSGVALAHFVSYRIGRPVSHREAAKIEIEDAKRLSGGNGKIAINCLAIMETTRDTILGAIDGGADAILIGAGLPLDLPEIVGDAKVALIPIISSGRALKTICSRWKRYDRTPDAVVLEGPLAGGHLGFKPEDIENPEMQLEHLLPSVLEVAKEYGDFPVIVAGGIWDRLDIIHAIEAGASGIQMGTRFLATKESGASEEFKLAVIKATTNDIEVAVNPGSPSGMPFRVISFSPGYIKALSRERPLKCDLGYMLYKGTCKAKESTDSFCICNALASATNTNPDPNELAIFTVGANASRVDRILSVEQLINELRGIE